MKPIIATLLITTVSFTCAAQPGRSFVRHDTLRLNAGDRGWIVPAAGNTGTETVAALLLRAIANGLQKAYDPITGERIPSASIYNWRQPVDTVMVWDEKKQVSEMKVVQYTLQPENISSIRVYLDWQLDLETGKLAAETRSIELFRNIFSASGMLIGQGAFCRIGDAP